MTDVSGALNAAALHEAGHAIVAVGLGLVERVPTVHLKPAGDTCGGCTMLDPPPDAADRIVIACAGVLAQMRLAGNSAEPGYEGDMGKAWDAAVTMALEQFPEDDDKKDQYVHVVVGASLAGRFLDSSWEFVESVAALLVESPHRVENLASIVPVAELTDIWSRVIAGR